jgi:hypothetical protein
MSPSAAAAFALLLKVLLRLSLLQPQISGADYGARTRHLDLGKVALYQMS